MHLLNPKKATVVEDDDEPCSAGPGILAGRSTHLFKDIIQNLLGSQQFTKPRVHCLEAISFVLTSSVKKG
jgi:hypothetical protein